MTRLTKEQAAIIGAYTGILAGPFVEMTAYIEQILGRPVWTTELADELVCKEIRIAATDDFNQIARET